MRLFDRPKRRRACRSAAKDSADREARSPNYSRSIRHAQTSRRRLERYRAGPREASIESGTVVFSPPGAYAREYEAP